MTKKMFFPLLCLLMSFQLMAQQDAPLTVEKAPSAIQHEIGLNATSFVKQIINLSDTTIATSPYLVTYKMIFDQRFAIRVGLGGKYKKSEETFEGFDDTSTNTNSAFDFRFGAEWQKQLSGQWRATLGFDVVVSSTKDEIEIDTGFDVVRFLETSSGYGAGPSLGLYFNINKSISLYTEAAAYYTVSKSSGKQRFKNFPEFDIDTDKIKEQKFEFQIPTTLYLAFRF